MVTGILGNGSKRAKKERPTDTDTGDRGSLHYGEDLGIQALLQKGSNQLSSAALVLCVYYTLKLAGSQVKKTPKESVQQTTKMGENSLFGEKIKLSLIFSEREKKILPPLNNGRMLFLKGI